MRGRQLKRRMLQTDRYNERKETKGFQLVSSHFICKKSHVKMKSKKREEEEEYEIARKLSTHYFGFGCNLIKNFFSPIYLLSLTFCRYPYFPTKAGNTRRITRMDNQKKLRSCHHEKKLIILR